MPGGKEAAKHSDEVTTYTKVKDIPCEMTKRTKHRIVYHKQHSGWVRQGIWFTYSNLFFFEFHS